MWRKADANAAIRRGEIAQDFRANDSMTVYNAA
jgi:hypothetical protein